MTIDEMVAALERELHFIEPEPIGASDPLDGWPVHKLAAWVYHGAGADWLTAMLKHADLRYEVLIDNAAELERRYLSHIAAILRHRLGMERKAAENVDGYHGCPYPILATRRPTRTPGQNTDQR